MCAWGTGSSSSGVSTFRSCDSILQRLERNDPALRDVTILPTKHFGPAEASRMAAVLNGGRNLHWRSLSASGHHLPPDSLYVLGRAISGCGRRRARDCDQSLRGLLSLSIGDSRMGDAGVLALCRGLSRRRCGGKDDFGDYKNDESNSTSNDDDDDDDGSQDGGCFPPLQTLDLSFKGMGSTGFQSIVRYLGGSPRLNRLDVSRNPGILSVDDARNAAGLSRFSPLGAAGNGNDLGRTGGGDDDSNHGTSDDVLNFEDLNLSDCGLDDGSLGRLSDLLRPISDRCKLRLSRNPIGGGSAGVGAGFRSLLRRHLSSLEEIYLSDCGIGDSGVELLSSAVISSSPSPSLPATVRVLDLSKNGITARGAAVLATCLCPPDSVVVDDNRNSDGTGLLDRLRDLDLSGNPLGEEGVLDLVGNGLKARSKRRRRCPPAAEQASVSLVSLDLSATGCGPTGAVAAVRDGGAVSLRLFDNRLGSSGFRALADSLSSLRADDDLNGGGGDDDSWSTPLLECLDLAGNDADEETVVELLSALLLLHPNGNVLPNLKALVVGGNRGGDRVEDAVRRLREARPELDVARDKVARGARGGR